MTKAALRKFTVLTVATAVLGVVLIVISASTHSVLLRTIGISFVLVMMLLLAIETFRAARRRRV